MAIEYFTRALSANTDALRVMGSHLSLAEPTEIHLFESRNRISQYEKHGPDLDVSLEDGRALYIENFFAAGPDGDFSSLIDNNGASLLSGLLVPEPDVDAMHLTDVLDEMLGTGTRYSTEIPDSGPEGISALSFSDATAGTPEIATGGIAPAGLGLASGLGSMSLFSLGTGRDAGSAPGVSEATASTKIDTLDQSEPDIAELLAASGESDALDDRFTDMLRTVSTGAEANPGTVASDAAAAQAATTGGTLPDADTTLVAAFDAPDLFPNDPVESEL